MAVTLAGGRLEGEEGEMRGGREGKEEEASREVVVIIRGGRRGAEGETRKRFGRGVAAIAAWNSCSASWVHAVFGVFKIQMVFNCTENSAKIRACLGRGF